jgi:hypothetical protein
LRALEGEKLTKIPDDMKEQALSERVTNVETHIGKIRDASAKENLSRKQKAK